VVGFHRKGEKGEKSRGGVAERGMATKNTKTQATRHRWRFLI
jgi:hypothetical protein